MGAKVQIGSYQYNSNRPRILIIIGGVLQGMGCVFTWFAVIALFGIFENVWFALSCFIILILLALIFRAIGRRLAIGKRNIKSAQNKK